MGSLHRDIKKLSCQYIAGGDTAANHGCPCTVGARIGTLCTAQAEFHDAVSARCIADAGSLGGNQALMVDDVQNSSFDKLCFHDWCDNLYHRFSGEHDASFRNRINIAGKFEVSQIQQKVFFENAETS